MCLCFYTATLITSTTSLVSMVLPVTMVTDPVGMNEWHLSVLLFPGA